MRVRVKNLFLFSLFFFCSLLTLFPKTISVPRDFSTIKSAIAASHDGDAIEVDDGFYFEDNIVIDKNIRLKAKNVYGAVIYGSQSKGAINSIFIVRAETEIEGFILKNGKTGIMQRDSPDVRWTAHDLAILNMEHCAVVVNDREKNVEKIIIIPDDGLFYLPFGSLIQGRNGAPQGRAETEIGGDGRYLIENFDIVYAPSASSLLLLRERKAMNKRNGGILAVAYPHTDNKRVIFSRFAFTFPRLKHVAEEVKTIGRFFREEQKTILLDKKAEERTFKELNLCEFKIIHFATHGLFDHEKWWRSALLLRRSDDDTEDGLLQPRDISSLNLCSDLVVLSACQTGIGRLESGEGIIGLSYSFFYAGARNVLVSLWNINDKSTSLFMKYFYARLTKGTSPERSLRLAKIEMINSKYSHPFYWAGFVLLGDSQVF